MDYKKLILGDLVNLPHGNFKVLSLREEDDEQYPIQVNDEFSSWYKSELVNPVPLTPEILEKIGFTKEVHGFYRMEIHEVDDYWCVEVVTLARSQDCFLDIEHYFDGISMGGIDNLRISSVDQLQHAFKLCGITKEIVI